MQAQQPNSLPKLDASFGIIPLKNEHDSWRVFIIRHKAGNHYGFPKGHPSSLVRAFSSASYAGQVPSSFSETPKETAERELLEETELTVTTHLPIEPLSTRYLCVSHGKYVDKTVTYFAAEVHGDIRLCPQEIAEGNWVTLDQAKEKMPFTEMRELVEKLQAALSGQ